jgi:hypothetical protein
MERIWTDDQVATLNANQKAGQFHPFTCGGSSEVPGCREVLVATPNGWVCPDPRCTYTQGWAHGFMMEPFPPDDKK